MSGEAPYILVVDDELDTCQNLHDILSDLGYRVDVASSGAEALPLVARNAYDIALLDLKMPGMDGLELYRRIRELRADTVAIIVTAYATSETARSALGAGAWRIMAKPVELPELISLVGEALEQPLVLIVDDDHDLCRSLWDLLRERGFRVGLAHNAEQAAEEIAAARHEVVLIDMLLPQTNGIEVFRLVRQAHPEARTVLITGHREETASQVRTILDEGANAVCYKPFEVDDLLTTLHTLVDAKKQ